MAPFECDKIKSLVRDALRQFFCEEMRQNKLCIDAMIGVTLEKCDMFYVTLSEVIQADFRQTDTSNVHAKKRRRKRSNSGTSSPNSTNSPAEHGANTNVNKNEESGPKSETSTNYDPTQTVVVKKEVDEEDDWYSQNSHDIISQEELSKEHFSDFPGEQSRSVLGFQDSDFGPSSAYHSNVSGEPERSPAEPSTSTQFTNLVPQEFPGLMLPPELMMEPEAPRRETPSKRYSLPISKKVELIEVSEGVSHRRLAEIFNISKSQVQSILKRKEEILLTYQDESKHNQTFVGDRMCKMKDVNELTWMWYQQMMSQDTPITGAQIQRQAVHFAKWLGKADEFKASNGWLYSFKQRHSIKNFGPTDKPANTELCAANMNAEFGQDASGEDVMSENYSQRLAEDPSPHDTELKHDKFSEPGVSGFYMDTVTRQKSPVHVSDFGAPMPDTEPKHNTFSEPGVSGSHTGTVARQKSPVHVSNFGAHVPDT